MEYRHLQSIRLYAVLTRMEDSYDGKGLFGCQRANKAHAKEAVESEVAGKTNYAICFFLDAIDAARVTTEEVHAQLGEISDRVRRTKKKESWI